MYSLSRYPYQPLQSDVPQIYTKKPFRMTNPSVSICVPNAQLPQLTILHFTGMSHSSGNGGATPKPNYNKHFPRSFMLNYGEALSNLPDEKILCRLFDWNCEWLSRPNIAISEMASTLKENWTNIMAYRGTVFTEEFVDDLRKFVDPIVDPLRRVDNKDKLDMDPPDANDVLKILKAINFDPWVEDLFTDAFNAVGPVLMMSIHILVINCLMHNPDVFAERSVRAPSTEKFKTDPTFKNMMRYLIDQILMRRRTVKRSMNDWDSAAYLDEDDEEHTQQRPSRSKRTLAHAHPKSAPSANAGASTSRRCVPQPSTSTDRAERGANSRRRRTSFDVSGIAALPSSEDEDQEPPARHGKKRRFVASPVEHDYSSQENETRMKRAKKNKRPLNGPSAAKNRREVLNLHDDTDEEADIFITQTTPPQKKKKKKRRRSPSPSPPPEPTTEDQNDEPQSEDAEAKAKKKHKKKKKNKDKTHQTLATLIADQDEVNRQLARGNRK